MSRRRNRNKAPNIPAETLERARRQAGIEPEAEVDEAIEEDSRLPIVPDEVEILPPEGPSIKPQPQAKAPKRKHRRSETPQARLSRKADSDQDYTSEEVAEILAHPTKFVSEEELQGQYNYVLVDLRNMGILAAALLVVLIILAQFV